MANPTKTLEDFFRQVDRANADLDVRWRQIKGHLQYGLGVPVAASAVLYKRYEPPTHYPGLDGRRHRKPIRALYGFGQSAAGRYDTDLAAYNAYAAAMRNEVIQANGSVDSWVRRAQTGSRDAVTWYAKTMFPVVFPAVPGGSAKYLVTGYSASERHLVIERFVPDLSVIPLADHYEIGRGAALRTISVSEPDRRWWYQHLLAQVALLTVDRALRCELYNVIDIVSVNLVSVIRNPATGHDEVVCLLSVSAPKQRFWNLNLLGVDPITCILDMRGRVTRHPGEYAPIEPWVKSDQGDVVVSVSDVPLLSMDPADFEQLVSQLLSRMGLRTRSTGRSGDGGVDCEAYDDRPVVGGKVIVQVKRYSSTVPPSVVRDLFGTVHATGATKGVLVTTSGFGPETRQFAEGKPLELIDGVQLEALLHQYQLSGTMSPAPSDASTELSSVVLQISPDGRYYWNGTTWQVIAQAEADRMRS